jgi:hypothetical protein
VPWNNNNAEHAVKSFVLLRRNISGFSTENGIKEYLVLLSICETCKYKKIDFLDFLRSGETDIEVFAQKKTKRAARSTLYRNTYFPVPTRVRAGEPHKSRD